MEVKIGLAAERVFDEQRLNRLTDYLPFSLDDDSTPTVIRTIAKKEPLSTKPVRDIGELVGEIDFPEFREPALASAYDDADAF